MWSLLPRLSVQAQNIQVCHYRHCITIISIYEPNPLCIRVGNITNFSYKVRTFFPSYISGACKIYTYFNPLLIIKSIGVLITINLFDNLYAGTWNCLDFHLGPRPNFQANRDNVESLPYFYPVYYEINKNVVCS